MHTQKTPENEMHTVDSPMEPMAGHADIPHSQSTHDALSTADECLLPGHTGSDDFRDFLNQVASTDTGWISDLF